MCGIVLERRSLLLILKKGGKIRNGAMVERLREVKNALL